VIGCSHGELGRFTAHDPVRCETTSVEMRSDEASETGDTDNPSIASSIAKEAKQ